jgi:murein DD-endopeptidase MepM/ murein hydrolase activator NlpD
MLVWRLWSNYYTGAQRRKPNFYTLYGHLSFSLEDLTLGTVYKKNKSLALGDSAVNGDYSPHLHFQVIKNMGAKVGDYPGVCTKANGFLFR